MPIPSTPAAPGAPGDGSPGAQGAHGAQAVQGAPGSQGSRRLALTAMLFAVGMTFIDQTIVAIASPTIQQHLSLSRTGTQWVVNAYLLALAATFALGGRLADVLGPKRMASAAPPGIQAQLHTVVSTDFATATKWVLYGMAIALGLTFLAALRHPARHASRATVTDEQAVSEAAG